MLNNTEQEGITSGMLAVMAGINFEIQHCDAQDFCLNNITVPIYPEWPQHLLAVSCSISLMSKGDNPKVLKQDFTTSVMVPVSP